MIDLLSYFSGIMASLVPPGGKKDYFRELHLKRQAQMAARGETPGGSAKPNVEAAIPITTGPAIETSRPVNPKKERKIMGRIVVGLLGITGSALCPKDLSRRADYPGGRVRVGPIFLDTS